MNILTFDIEEWFHILDNPKTKYEKDWKQLPSRIEEEIEIIFDILSKNNNSATFFILGWIAEKFPNLVRDISDRGYQIGSHTHYHQLIYEQSPAVFKKDVEKSIKSLEDCTGKKVECFRAPGFSINESNLWAFEILIDLGIKIDSSIFPANRAHGGYKNIEINSPCLINYNGLTLKEFPINTYKFLNKKIVFSGGGYFRILPFELIKYFIRRSDYVMSYFHPRDFDYLQPDIPGLNQIRKFKSNVGLKSCKNKLNKILDEFNFFDIESADKKINWNNKVKIKL
tara:strand:- start:191 stop:1039 length:849 start_codon:yes stop_codon:yes gene_type:complete